MHRIVVHNLYAQCLIASFASAVATYAREVRPYPLVLEIMCMYGHFQDKLDGHLNASALAMLIQASHLQQVSHMRLCQSHQSCHVLGLSPFLGQLVTAEHVDRDTHDMCRVSHIHIHRRNAPVACFGILEMLLLSPAFVLRQVFLLQLCQSYLSCHMLGLATSLDQLVTAEHVDRLTLDMCCMLPHIHIHRRSAPVACLSIPVMLLHTYLAVTCGGSLRDSFSLVPSSSRLLPCHMQAYVPYMHCSEIHADTHSGRRRDCLVQHLSLLSSCAL